MAHFAQLDENNVVIDILKVNNEDMLDANGQEQEYIGVAFLKNLFGQDIKWVQTSYNGNFRKMYAGLGFLYDEEYDQFVPPRPFSNWILNKPLGEWEAPVPYPTDGKEYFWEESMQSWQEVPPFD